MILDIIMSVSSNTPIKTGKRRTAKIFRILFSCLIIFLVACAPKPDDTLRMGLASAPVTLDPRYATDATSSRINRLIYTRLVEFNDQQLPVPGLASWEVISPLHYRFTLKKEREAFHDGSQLTANDVKATYDSILDQETASPHRATLDMIQQIEVIDNETIDFHLSREDLLFPAYLVIGILPANKIAINQPFHNAPVGNGPFRFIEWPEEGRLHLRRIKDGQELTFVRVKNSTVRVLKLIRGEVDLIQNDLPPELVTYLREKDDIDVVYHKGSNFAYLGFNLEDPVVGKQEVRKAIAMAINREEIIKYLLGGGARLASSLLPPDHWAGDKNLSGLDYSPEVAKSLLVKNGFDENKPLRLVYKTSTDEVRLRIATVIQNQLKRVGVDVDIRSYDWGTFYGDIKAGNFQMFSLIWVGVKTPDIFRYIFHSKSIPPQGANRGRYKDGVTDQLIEDAGKRTTLKKQGEIYRKLQERLLEEIPYVPLWYEDHFFAIREGISGYSIGLDGNYDGLVDIIKKHR